MHSASCTPCGLRPELASQKTRRFNWLFHKRDG